MSERPIKVLSVCTFLYGGAGHASYRIHQGVRNLGVDSRMLVMEKYGNDPNVVSLAEFIPSNSLYKAFDWTRNKFKNKLQHFYWNRYPEYEKVYLSDLRGTDLHGALKKLDYDVLHLHWINHRFIPLKALPKDKPIVWTLHDSWPFCGICHYFLECEGYKQQCGSCPFLHSKDTRDLSHQVWMKKNEIYRDLDLHIVTPSRWLGSCAKQSGLLRRFPVTAIPNCLDEKLFRILDEEEISSRWSDFKKRRSEKPIVLFGAMNASKDRIKGFLQLLHALRILEEQGHFEDFELVVFGANKSDAEMDVRIPIHYVGYVHNARDLVSLYNIASVMVVPSLTEVFGQTASEAMACGTPVVAFQCTGIQEVVDHKVNGYLAKPYESEDLAAGILWCLENNKENRLGMAAREKVLREYAMGVVGEQYRELYKSVQS